MSPLELETRIIVLSLALVAGCGDDETHQPVASGGQGGTGATTAAGGSGASGGAGGVGGAGGAASPCLDASVHADAFTIEAEGLCVVDTVEAPFAVASYAPPTWGAHGGPLTLEQGYDGADPADEITLTRWQREGVDEELSVEQVVGPVTVGAVVATPYFSPIAVDMPGAGLTFVGYADFSFTGEVVALDGPTVAGRWDTSGYYWGAVTTAGADERFVHTSQGPLDESGGATPALYAADICAGPSLCADGAKMVEAWGQANGPVASDAQGNLFAVQTDFVQGDQTLRGYPAAAVAPMAPGDVAGTELFTLPGFGSSLAAIAPQGGDGGYVLFQPQELDSDDEVVSGDVVGLRFTAGDALSAEGPASPAVVLSTAGTEVTLMSDDADRIWLGIATGPSASTFYVLQRASAR